MGARPLSRRLRVPDAPATEVWDLESIVSSGQQEALSHGDIDRDGDHDVLLGTVWLDNHGGSTFIQNTLSDWRRS